MLRNGITISINDLVEKFNCDKFTIYKQIVNAIKNKTKSSRYSDKSIYHFSTNSIYTNNDFTKYDFSCEAKTFDEFMVQVDLGVK